MLSIEVDSAAVEAKIEALTENVKALHTKVPDEFLEWQRDDMNRRYPTITEESTGSWFTEIFPRSRRLRTRAEQQRRRRIVPQVAISTGGGTRRPILREELFEMLRDRMRKLLDDVMPRK